MVRRKEKGGREKEKEMGKVRNEERKKGGGMKEGTKKEKEMGKGKEE